MQSSEQQCFQVHIPKLVLFHQHIYFEEDKLFPEIEDQFTSAEKEWVETEIQFNIHDWPKIQAFSGG